MRFQGGGYFAGAGSEWDGTSLVRRSVATDKPIIWITFNYRIGVLGFVSPISTALLRRRLIYVLFSSAAHKHRLRL
jgi:carboxylesterase type B